MKIYLQVCARARARVCVCMWQHVCCIEWTIIGVSASDLR